MPIFHIRFYAVYHIILVEKGNIFMPNSTIHCDTIFDLLAVYVQSAIL